MIKVISTKKAQKPIGPYSQAVEANGFIFCSGTAGVEPKTEKLVHGLESQTLQVFKNVREVLYAAGSDLSKILKVTIYLKDMKNFNKVNKIYEEFFNSHQPARTTVEVSNLAKKGALIVVDVIALVK